MRYPFVYELTSKSGWQAVERLHGKQAGRLNVAELS